MKNHPFFLVSKIFIALLVVLAGISCGSLARATSDPQVPSEPIPFGQIGAVAQKQYSGDAIGITATENGVRLRTGFQSLEAEATREGLWLNSTEKEGGRFRLVTSSIGRNLSHSQLPCFNSQLPTTGTVTATDQLVTFTRPGLTEEYSVSMDGLRQDFIVAERPAGDGELRVELALEGASAESAGYGAKIIIGGSERELAYSRLHVTDAKGRELTARLEVHCTDRVTVWVDDASATYPVCIDPTFSDADWVSLNSGIPGANDQVNAAVLDGNGNLYIGGWFSFVGTVPAKCIAKWNGSTWTALGTGMSNGTSGSVIWALAVSGTDLYAGGEFTTAGGVDSYNIAKWNGNAWTSLPGVGGSVRALAVSDTSLYAGGVFTAVGGITTATNYIAKWNGTTWSALGLGMNGRVDSLAVNGTDLYAGGGFTTAGGVAARKIAKWNGSTWSALGTGVGVGDNSATVNALAVSGTTLYAGGYFLNAGGLSAQNVAKWNGTAWSALGGGVNSHVYALAVSGTDLYVGGSFTSIGTGGVMVKSIAKWNGSGWLALGSGMAADGPSTPATIALAVSGTTVYAVGQFTSMDTVSARCVAKWNGSAWSALGWGMDRYVYALAASGTDLYVGGSFTSVGTGGWTSTSVAKWNGSSWSPLGSGMAGLDPYVAALAVSGADLYAGGNFYTAGGEVANCIAKWNGTAWSALASGLNGIVKTLAISGPDLYVGGRFTAAGDVTANRIAKWNGSTWSALGEGMSGEVDALAVSGTDIYAGGYFSTADGILVNSIAKWDGTAWSGLGSGIMGGAVNALAISGTNLYAGGSFTVADGVTANHIAKWNGSTWSALGSGMNVSLNSGVSALAVNGTDLYAGGDFTTADGILANRIAKWNGSAWAALGSGMDASVQSLAVDSSNHLYVGGSFYIAGTTVSPFIAMANLPAGSVVPTVTNPAATSVTGNGATLGGNVTSDGGAAVAMRGVIYSQTATNSNPQIGGAGVTNVSGTGTIGIFTVNASGLAPATAYTFKAYASNGVGTGYSTTGSFTTLQAAPEIAVEHPLSSNVADGGSRAFGSVALGANSFLTFTLKNTGNADLTGLSITQNGTDSADFTITASPVAPVSGPGGSTSFTVRFSPTTLGTKTAAIHIASNDADENPFDINLSGSGATAATVFNDAIAASSTLTGPAALPAAIPFGDGVENLLKYAFNMNLAGPDARSMTAGTGTAGLPAFALVGTGAATEIRMEFLRRKGSGLIYTAKHSTDLTAFAPMTGTTTVTSINDQWERVLVQEPCNPATTPRSFGIVEVSLP